MIWHCALRQRFADEQAGPAPGHWQHTSRSGTSHGKAVRLVARIQFLRNCSQAMPGWPAGQLSRSQYALHKPRGADSGMLAQLPHRASFAFLHVLSSAVPPLALHANVSWLLQVGPKQQPVMAADALPAIVTMVNRAAALTAAPTTLRNACVIGTLPPLKEPPPTFVVR